MKKSMFPIVLILMVAFSCSQGNSDSSTERIPELSENTLEKNKELATLYHDLNPENIDILFTEDFIGHGENEHTWDRQSHRNYLSNDRYIMDEIIRQVAEGDWVATMFIRTMEYEGDTISVPIMHFKRFENGMIAEVWEYYDYDEESEE